MTALDRKGVSLSWRRLEWRRVTAALITFPASGSVRFRWVSTHPFRPKRGEIVPRGGGGEEVEKIEKEKKDVEETVRDEEVEEDDDEKGSLNEKKLK